MCQPEKKEDEKQIKKVPPDNAEPLKPKEERVVELYDTSED